MNSTQTGRNIRPGSRHLHACDRCERGSHEERRAVIQHLQTVVIGLLIAVSAQLDVLGWQCCSNESTAAWTALLERIPAPAVILSDGGTGLRSAIRKCRPETTIRRAWQQLNKSDPRRHRTQRRRPRSCGAFEWVRPEGFEPPAFRSVVRRGLPRGAFAASTLPCSRGFSNLPNHMRARRCATVVGISWAAPQIAIDGISVMYQDMGDSSASGHR